MAHRFWALQWRSKNQVDGESIHLMWEDGKPLVFRTRALARSYRDEHYDYIRTWPDLQREPHGWSFPRVVRAIITFEEAGP